MQISLAFCACFVIYLLITESNSSHDYSNNKLDDGVTEKIAKNNLYRVFHLSFWCLQWHRIFKIFHHVIIIFLHKCLRISHFLFFLYWNPKFWIDNHRTNDIVKLRILSRKCLSTFYQYFLSTKKYMIMNNECPKNGSCLMPYKDKRKIDWPKHKINDSKLDLIHHLDFKLYLKLFFLVFTATHGGWLSGKMS